MLTMFDMQKMTESSIEHTGSVCSKGD